VRSALTVDVVLNLLAGRFLDDFARVGPKFCVDMHGTIVWCPCLPETWHGLNAYDEEKSGMNMKRKPLL